MSAPRAHTTPEVLQWARESAAIPLELASRRAGVTPEQLAQAERGDHLLTLRQARLLAETYGRSLAFLLMPSPPDEPSLAMKFRRLRGAPSPPWSSDLIRLEREIRDRQDATVELYAALGDEPPWHEAASRLGLPDRVPNPAHVRALLSLDHPALRAPPGATRWFSRRVVLRSVEWTGVLVVRQAIPDEAVRGFLLTHEDAPAIYINSRTEEDPRAQAYTMVHEFAHLLLAAAGQVKPNEEEWCNGFAGEVLMPKDEFAAQLEVARTPSPITTAKAVAWQFGVTPYAAAVRAWKLDLFTADEMVAVRNRPTEQVSSDGGDGNRNKVARLSPTFTDLVLAAADSSAVTLSTASRLLRTKVDDFDKLREFSSQALAE